MWVWYVGFVFAGLICYTDNSVVFIGLLIVLLCFLLFGCLVVFAVTLFD